MTLTNTTLKKMILNLLQGKDYRIEVITLLNALFLQYALDFFKKVVEAKLHQKNIDTDW